MKYSEIDLQCEDIMWFGVDKNGYVFECTTGGIGCVPAFVCESREETEHLADFFLDTLVQKTIGNLLVDENGSPLAVDCKTLSSKGVFCFDVAVDDNRPDEYKKVSFPQDPLRISELPDDIKRELSSHLVDLDVSKQDYIRVQHAY